MSVSSSGLTQLARSRKKRPVAVHAILDFFDSKEYLIPKIQISGRREALPIVTGRRCQTDALLCLRSTVGGGANLADASIRLSVRLPVCPIRYRR